VNALYQRTLARWRGDPTDPSVFVREPSLSDPAWLDRIAARLRGLAAAYAPLRPLFINLGDETGIADNSAAWDFDRGPDALPGFRRWLAARYGDLAALDKAWDAHFADWSEVVPDTTFEAMRRPDGNLASWADFKAWMDESFAHAVRAGTNAVHQGDPAALAGLEGVQLPGWGGYDYATLAPAVDLMEIYDDEVSIEIAEDLHPGLIVLTSGPPKAEAAPAMWDALLRGSRGLIVWDDSGALARPDGAVGPAANEFASLLSRIRQVAPRLLDSEPVHDPVAILYSQPSFRARWMLDQRQHGDAWVELGAEGENADNAWRHAMRGAGVQLLHLGIRPRWVDGEALVHGLGPETKILLLPQAIALSDKEATAIAAFGAAGGTVVADVPPGSLTDSLRPRTPLGERDGVQVVTNLWEASDAASSERLRSLLATAGVYPLATVTGEDGNAVDSLALRFRRIGADASLLLTLYNTASTVPGSVSVRPDCGKLGRLFALEGGGESVPTTRIRLTKPEPAIVQIAVNRVSGNVVCKMRQLADTIDTK
jgi:hypothetical protein